MRSSRSRYIGSHGVSFFDDQVQRCEQRSSKLEGYTFCATPSTSSFRKIFLVTRSTASTNSKRRLRLQRVGLFEALPACVEQSLAAVDRHRLEDTDPRARDVGRRLCRAGRREAGCLRRTRCTLSADSAERVVMLGLVNSSLRGSTNGLRPRAQPLTSATSVATSLRNPSTRRTFCASRGRRRL